MTLSRVELEACDVGRRGDRAGAWLLRGIDLSVRAGDRIGLVGPTGSGKSTFLRALALLDPLDTGQVRWRGAPVRSHDVPRFRSQVIYVHQRPVLFEGSVEENLRMPFTLARHANRRFDRQRVVDWLAALELDTALLARRHTNLSGGEAQITALLRAICLEPTVLLLDEPTSGLDSDTARRIEGFVDRWLRELPDRRAALWVTHDRGQVRRVADRIVRLAGGRIQAGGQDVME